MVRRRNLGSWIALALVAEMVAFVAVCDAIGIGPTVALMLLTSLIGAARLRRSGRDALAGLRAVAEGREARDEVVVDGLLGAAGALLLVLPGFLSDAAGLVLLAPSGRQWARQRLGLRGGIAGPRRRPDGILDLGAGDWTRLDSTRPR